MTMTTREAFEKGTDTVNARDEGGARALRERVGEDARVLELGLDPYDEQFRRAHAAHVAPQVTGSLLEVGR